MPLPYAARFGQALSERLPDFYVHAEQHTAVAYFGTAMLLCATPYVHDRRAAVDPDDVTRWIDQAARKLRREIQFYTPSATEAAEVLLDRLDEILSEGKK